MSTIKDGGPAFPLAGFQDNEGPVFGMSLRDYFAAKAMHTAARMLADTLDEGCTLKEGYSEVQVIAAAAYKLADAMLVAREAQP